MKMKFNYNLVDQEKYIRENHYKKTMAFNLYCCQLTFYENATKYLQEFICNCCNLYNNRS